MPVPWPTTRLYEQRRGVQKNGSIRSAAVGPALPVNGLKGDVESQTAFTEISNGVVTGTEPKADLKLDVADAGLNVVETQMSVLTFLKIVTAISALYMCTNPWFLFYNADKGEICPTTVLCATTPVQLALLTGSRVSAGVLFASLTISIFSKCYATRAYLHRSWLGAVIDLEPTHDVHTYFGYLTLVATLEHAILHCVRFISAKQAYLIYGTDTGRSGMVGCILLLPIVLPMKFEFIRTKISFEFRKSLHLMFLPLIVALCFHSVVFRYVGSILVLWYLADRLYFTTKQTFLITHPVFEAVGRGTRVTFDLPGGYTFNAGSYIYVNSPTISRSEWHPFSIIQVPGRVPRATFYAEAVGDWTQELFRLGLQQPRLPLWITTAQPSLMEQSIYYKHVVLVCTGAGITPAVSIIERFAQTKNIHLLWMSRDVGLVAVFEKQLRQVNSTVHLTGTQSEETRAAVQRLLRASAKNVSYSAQARPTTIVPHFFCKRCARQNASAHEGIHPDRFEVTREGSCSENNFAKPLQHLRRLRTFNDKPTNPVALEFGRPDIGAYLTGTFAIQMETSRRIDESNIGHSIDVSGTYRRESLSNRLDADQKVSKEELMRADAHVVEITTTNNSGTSSSSSSTRPRPNSPLPWLVLYCGANPKVEKAIAETCDELHVNWKKEYFGAW
eukprot:jgi/Undpi1/2142/HiC_scaffold_12.g05528.m1